MDCCIRVVMMIWGRLGGARAVHGTNCVCMLSNSLLEELANGSYQFSHSSST